MQRQSVKEQMYSRYGLMNKLAVLKHHYSFAYDIHKMKEQFRRDSPFIRKIWQQVLSLPLLTRSVHSLHNHKLVLNYSLLYFFDSNLCPSELLVCYQHILKQNLNQSHRASQMLYLCYQGSLSKKLVAKELRFVFRLSTNNLRLA